MTKNLSVSEDLFTENGSRTVQPVKQQYSSRKHSLGIEVSTQYNLQNNWNHDRLWKLGN